MNKDYKLLFETAICELNNLEEGLLSRYLASKALKKNNHKAIQKNIINIHNLGNIVCDDTSGTFNKWKNIIEGNSQHIINCFLSNILTNVYQNRDTKYWDRYTNIHDKDDKRRDMLVHNLKKEIPIYRDIKNKKNIKDLFIKYLPKFNYQQLLNSIELECLTLEENGFGLQLSDNLGPIGEFFCSACLYFSGNTLTPEDWHNF